MRKFLVSIISGILILSTIQFLTQSIYASHGPPPSNNFALECYFEAQDGNCENAAVPDFSCPPGFTGADCCAKFQNAYKDTYPGITATCGNACSYTFASPNVQPRSGPVCPVIDGEGGLQSFCCQYSFPYSQASYYSFSHPTSL